MEKVAVLMCTYNGESWIEDQIRSIAFQNNIKPYLYISDDGSQDNTYQQAIRACNEFEMSLHISENKSKYFKSRSAARNFYRIIIDTEIPKEYKWVAFSDQDDIWNHSHLERSIEILSQGKFNGYSSSVTAFWPNSKRIFIKKSGIINKLNYLFESAGPGCTYVLPRKIFDSMRSHFKENIDILDSLDFHDWSIYAYVSRYYSNWFIDDFSSLLYRQHSNNVLGSNNTLKGFLERVKLILGSWYRNQVLTLAKLVKLENNKIIYRYQRLNIFDRIILSIQVLKMRRKLMDKIMISLSTLICKK